MVYSVVQSVIVLCIVLYIVKGRCMVSDLVYGVTTVGFVVCKYGVSVGLTP